MEPKNVRHYFWLGMAKILSIISIFGIITLAIGLLALSFVGGYIFGQRDAQEKIIASLEDQGIEVQTSSKIGNTSPTTIPSNAILKKTPPWGGVELWETVNKRRAEFGVNPLKKKDELCTIASIRLNELMELGKLDNHEGFGNMVDRRPDLKWIFQEFGNVSEFLAQGGTSAQETVSLWENTLGHKLLLSGGEYVWGCTYAQNNFAVAITAY